MFFFRFHRRPTIRLGLKLRQRQLLTLPRQCLLIGSWLTGDHLVSASLCEQGDNLFLLVAGGEQSTSCLFLCLPSIAIFTTCSDKNRKSSFLLLSKRKNSCQFGGTTADGRTLLLAPVPLFCLVLAFKLLGIYSSRTNSSLCTFSIDCLMYGSKTFSLYSMKVYRIVAWASERRTYRQIG